MTTVCFLPPEPSACRGNQMGVVHGPSGGPGPRGGARGAGWPPTSPPLQPAPSAAWSWVPRSGPSSCLQPVLPSLGAHCGPMSHCHHCCCHCCCHHHCPQESLGREKPLGYKVLENLSPLGSQPHSHLGFILHLEAGGTWILTPIAALPCSKSFHSCPLLSGQWSSSLAGWAFEAFHMLFPAEFLSLISITPQP